MVATLRMSFTGLSGGFMSANCGSQCGDSSSKGASGVIEIPSDVKQRIASHPCYSFNAHNKFARMHLAVAPGCNVQCNYCNRKFDCANESRPGVVSELLNPEQAVRKARHVAKTIPQLSVIGIAGPGDPLANPGRTFKTLELLRQQLPDVKLCISTNGLALPEMVDRLGGPTRAHSHQ
jgi:nitrogen fixation protein NifB